MSRPTLSLCLCSALLGACQPEPIVLPPAATAATSPAPAVNQPTALPVVSYVNGLQYNGAIGVVQTDTGGGTGTWVVEISAPLLPLMEYTYGAQGVNYPKSAADEQALTQKVTITYETLLSSCADYYPDIILTTAMGPPLTKAQLDSNYLDVADCAYTKYGTKPYWIPAMINDVSICELTLGTDWHLLSESDLAGFSDADYQLFAATLQSSVTSGLTNFYFSLNVFVHGNDGRLKMGTLKAGAATMLQDISDVDLSAKQTWVPQASSDYRPRCIRRRLLEG